MIARKVIAGVLLASSAAVAFISQWETGSPDIEGETVYADLLADGLPTACFGITKYITHEQVIVGDYWPADKCQRVATEALEKVQVQLARCLGRPLPPQSVFDALSSHAWNLGAAATCGSVSVELVKQGELKAACNTLAFTPSGRPNWSFVRNGVDPQTGKPKYKFIKGLHNRRMAERDMCLQDVQQ